MYVGCPGECCTRGALPNLRIAFSLDCLDRAFRFARRCLFLAGWCAGRSPLPRSRKSETFAVRNRMRKSNPASMPWLRDAACIPPALSCSASRPGVRLGTRDRYRSRSEESIAHLQDVPTNHPIVLFRRIVSYAIHRCAEFGTDGNQPVGIGAAQFRVDHARSWNGFKQFDSSPAHKLPRLCFCRRVVAVCAGIRRIGFESHHCAHEVCSEHIHSTKSAKLAVSSTSR